MKNFNTLFLASLLVIFGSCEPNEIELQDETGSLGDISSLNVDDVASLVVPEGHDLRAINLQNTNIRLSESSHADVVKVSIFKVDNDVHKLLYQGSIDRMNSIKNTIQIPNHTSLVSVQAELATNTREWIITPQELENLIIEDDNVTGSDDDLTSPNANGRSSGNTPPSWDCNDYQEFNGNDDGNFRITNNSTRGINVGDETSIYICAGSSWNPAYLNDNGGKLTIYVANGATLSLAGTINSTIYNVGTFNGTNLNLSNKAEFENWGTTNITGSFDCASEKVEIWDGVCNISGNLSIQGNDGHFDNDGGKVNVGGHMTISGEFHNKENSEINVAGNFTVNSNGEFKNYCKAIISGNFINNEKVELKNASYTSITGGFISNSNDEVKIKEGSMLKSASIMSNSNIKGSNATSVIETGAITFNGNKKFKGDLDICSGSYTPSMGDNHVISSCTTFISSSSCSPGYNNVVDNDNDGSVAGVDVDDNNPNVATYNFPQGQDSFFTTLYEDLYPCMGDYDLNDLVHNYTYREGINNGASNDGRNTSITEIKFDYKFPALGAAFNNSFVLRVIDQDNNATISLVSSDRYSMDDVTRQHDSENGTTLFIFDHIKNIYTDNANALVNTDQIDYSDIPVISGTVSNINGAYDEFILKDGESGQEIHPLYNILHINYRALNSPTMFFDSSNFLQCDDSSSTIDNLFVNANGFPWVLNDIPVELPWPKSGVPILEAYPNFDNFVTVLPNSDWYSDTNGNRVVQNLIIID